MLNQFDIDSDCHFVTNHPSRARHPKIVAIDFGDCGSTHAKVAHRILYLRVGPSTSRGRNALADQFLDEVVIRNTLSWIRMWLGEPDPCADPCGARRNPYAKGQFPISQGSHQTV